MKISRSTICFCKSFPSFYAFGSLHFNGNVIGIHDRIIFDFYTGLPHDTYDIHTYIHTYIHMQPEHSYVPHAKEFSNYCTVMWSPKVTYFNVLKFLNTRGSASAMAPSSPISLQWISSHSRLYFRK